MGNLIFHIHKILIKKINNWPKDNSVLPLIFHIQFSHCFFIFIYFLYLLMQIVLIDFLVYNYNFLKNKF